ncbi:glycoside hydrolase family 97 protein [Niastella vici]|nr:glycoside hydrolase family 97 protein [Niastella vici]
MIKIKATCCLLLLVILGQTGHAQVAKVYKALSPDRSTGIETGVSKSGQLLYRLFVGGQLVIDWSALGITPSNNVVEPVTIINEAARSNRQRFAWPLGESDTITNDYNELMLSCVAPSIHYNFIARVYNGSLAFRYQLSKTSPAVNSIKKEQTSFQFTGPYTLYQYNTESVFTPVTIDSFRRTCDLPATLTNGKWYLSIGEAANDHFTKAELKRGTAPHSLEVAYVRDTAVHIVDAQLTPWRTISVSPTAIGLHQFSQLGLQLNPPPANGIPAGVQPGKLIRSVVLTTQSGLDCIDFAAAHNLQYIMYDAGWYGAEFNTVSDPTQPIPQIDMPAVIAHGKEKGIGVILYVNYVGLKQKLDTLLPLYKNWGVAGMKFGFVDALTQKGLNWLSGAIKKVNEYGFVLNIHDNYKPTGLSRTYPALLTQEGIRGNENTPDAFHNTVLPFTRFIGGAADYTFCYPNIKESYSHKLTVSKAQQLALTVIYFSPLQSCFWYGKPADYTNEEEIEFFKYVPTVWNESHYLLGEIGKNITVARRKGNTWFVGSAAGLTDWQSNLPLNFLSKGKKYIATVYEDDEAGGIRKTAMTVKKGDVIHFDIRAKGGQAMVIRPAVP